MTTTDAFTLAERIRDALRCRAALGYGRAEMSFAELADLLFSRWPGDGRPTRPQVRAALRVIGVGTRRLRIVAGRIVFTQ
jgi:hypothetical protein